MLGLAGSGWQTESMYVIFEIFKIKTHGKLRGQKEAGLRDKRVSYVFTGSTALNFVYAPTFHYFLLYQLECVDNLCDHNISCKV